MTALLSVNPPDAPRSTADAPWRKELRELVRLAAPIVATQVCWVAMMTTDTAMIGHLGADALAGAGLSLMVFFIGFLVCFGVILSTAGLAAQAYGARRPRILRRVIRQGLWATILLVTPCMVGLGYTGDLLAALGQPPEALPHADAYMSTLMWSLPFTIAFNVLRNFVSALGRPGPALWAMAAGVPLNALLDYALIFGNLGLPRLEIMGAGIATASVNCLMFLFLCAIALWRKPFAKYQIFARFWRPDWQIFAQIFRIGTPIAIMSVLEGGFFIGAVFVIGQFGAVAVAAHMIAMQMPHITFMVPMGLAQAATVRVGQMAGRRDLAGAYRAGWTALAVTALFMTLTTVVIATTTGPFARVFMDPALKDGMAVLGLAQSLLMMAALFQLADGVQAVAAGALRGVNDTKVPMVNAVASFWGLGAVVVWLLAFQAGLGPHGIWWGFIVGLIAAAVTQTLRFRRLHKRGHLPEIVGD